MSDHIKCITKWKSASWCGKRISSHDFHFTDVDHAAKYRDKDGRLLVCKDCAAAVTKALNSGYEDE